MATDALLYEILINKSKLKPLNSNADELVDIPLTAFTLSNNVVVDEAHFNTDNHLATANQIFTQECLSSIVIKDNVLMFNDFVKTEIPLMITKFEKSLIGKSE
jgi:hypothetical protein